MMQGVPGFRFAAIDAGIKRATGPDLALAVAAAPVAAAGLFTRNLVRAAPCELAAKRVATGRAQAVLVNSGCANACTGKPGLAAAQDSTAAVARALEIAPELVLPASTGVIGELLPAERVTASVGALVASLAGDAVEAFADAIRTTDRFTKVARADVGPARVLGIAKGAGMIHPDMATMLAFLFTDARVDEERLKRCLETANDTTFNACTVDGDTSTNDCALILASGESAHEPADADFTAAVADVCGELARMMVSDGEGASHAVDFVVSGLSTMAEARVVARTIATSLLVKTALFGKDANWGRILGAAGRSGVAFDPTRARIVVGGIEIVSGGLAVGGDAEARAAEVMSKTRYTIEVELGDGPGRFTYVTSDLGHGYVDVNAGYRS